MIGASERLRPILMTACAMTIGMVPMALALERGSQMQAPLGRAVIGGLVMSTFATLLFVPSIFAIVIGKKAATSPSIHPADPDSRHYSPEASSSRPRRRKKRMRRTDRPGGRRRTRGDGACIGALDLARPEVPDAPRFVRPRVSDRAARRPPAACSGSWPPSRRRAVSHEPEIEFITATKPPTVRLVQPRARNIVRVVGQPSFIESYERTSIYPKPTAYIQKWIVDIGDKVKKVDVLATLFAPELVEELGTKKAAVVLDRERIALAKEVVEVARADVEAAEARLAEAEAILDKYEAEVVRWDTEVKRLERQVARVVINAGVLFESTNQLKSSIAARDKAKATIKRAKAELLAARARLEKAQVDVRVAEAALKVAEYEEKYAQAWVDYLTLNGSISRRDLGPQRQHVRLRPAHDRRPHGLLPLPRHLAQRHRRADLRGRPSRHRPDLSRHPGTGRQLREDRHQGERACPGVPRHGAAGHRHADRPGR